MGLPFCRKKLRVTIPYEKAYFFDLRCLPVLTNDTHMPSTPIALMTATGSPSPVFRLPALVVVAALPVCVAVVVAEEVVVVLVDAVVVISVAVVVTSAAAESGAAAVFALAT